MRYKYVARICNYLLVSPVVRSDSNNMLNLSVLLMFAVAVGMGISSKVPRCENSTLLVNTTVEWKGCILGFDIQFRTDRVITDGRANATYWLWDTYEISKDLHPPHLCDSIFPGCPLRPDGTIYKYENWIGTPKERSFQAWGTLSWTLQDQDGRTILCVNFPLS
ncbi:hypothetical protein D915_008071 [Fasciola hepatica]|uniref:MD-2-related lipid-recognition domain-containing protein n=1 Tax=Fasciola hepatica TaxID=6192 RepID=A0A4E0RJL4_FASHE|nr:hypothetical protein D915_008071 [Fasciola hepatica]